MTTGIIYKISSPNLDKFYIGSTTQTLKKRFNNHKNKFKRFQQQKETKYSLFDLFEKDDINNFKIEEIVITNDIVNLRRAEGEFIKMEPNCVNKKIDGRTKQEYYLDFKEKINKYNNDYKQTHKEEIKEQQSTYHECECGLMVSNRNKARHRRSQVHKNGTGQGGNSAPPAIGT
jgi:hypothetical protein